MLPTILLTEQNKEIIRCWIANANQGFQEPFETYLAPDFVGHSQTKSIDLGELKQLELTFVHAFPDATYTIEDLIAEADKVVLRVTTRGTHRQPFYGVAPTHRSIEFTGIVIYRIQNGRIAECWDEIDFPRLWNQVSAS